MKLSTRPPTSAVGRRVRDGICFVLRKHSLMHPDSEGQARCVVCWRSIAVPRPYKCPSCNGYGGFMAVECGVCGGDGMVWRELLERLAFGDSTLALKARLALRQTKRREPRFFVDSIDGGPFPFISPRVAERARRVQERRRR